MKRVMLSNRTGLILALSLVSAYVASGEEVELKFVVQAEQIQGALRTFTQGKSGIFIFWRQTLWPFRKMASS
jgi:hypothetical protein